MTELTIDGADFSDFTMLYLDETGRFLDIGDANSDDTRPVEPDELERFLKRTIILPKDVTDVFVWVHGWQNDELRAVSTARRMFANLASWFTHQSARYPKLGKVVPGFVAVHWPSSSLPTLGGYKKIRDRAKYMTTQGEAEFFLASLLGYLDAGNQRSAERKVLRAKDGFYVHCLGHSFGGRFLAAAIKAAATPQKRKILAAHRETGSAFNVDSLCVLQMAAGSKAFGTEFEALLQGPICGPVVLTTATSDTALCSWHAMSEGEAGIGCTGAIEPGARIGSINLLPIAQSYSDNAFSKDITNVNASRYFTGGGWIEGAHSQFWHEETMHLIASLVEQVR
ncbi:hypothetical protein JQ607_35170 [Bradyrhizobium liaoningense]|uniref:hypothetical protein n=1 Tax=Bradyrhizobium liaoningense TaxID=43992 RepID=UPI001BA6533E|nr:hypothetical protein [Bradyrhizobium liaoningense]MBR0845460.1 hypothetical protein [Bradyrhizobium liaoningense]MBR0855369.1 hypothetical protein [Bradyrhizobium liaoningense]